MKINPKKTIPTLVSVGLGLAITGCIGVARASHSNAKSDPANFTHEVGGFQVHLAIVAEPVNREQRQADHAWTPNGAPYQGSESRLSTSNLTVSPKGDIRRRIVFELDKLQRSGGPTTIDVDVFSFTPNNSRNKADDVENSQAAGPFPIQVWNGELPRGDLRRPDTVEFEYGVKPTPTQPVVFGIAQGEYKSVAKGPISIAELTGKNLATLASGNWGRIGVSLVPQPTSYDSRPPTHRFQLLGGPFPPTTERRVLFYNSQGKVVVTGGDGPNNPGFAGGHAPFPGTTVNDVTSFEIQERPYEYTQFNGVNFQSPRVKGSVGKQGYDHIIDSPIGKIVGVLKPVFEGHWTSDALYATDGTRWLDPGQDLASHEYVGNYSEKPSEYDNLCIMLQPKEASQPTICEVFAADSPNGPDREKLTFWNKQPLQMPMATIACRPTSRPFLHLKFSTDRAVSKTTKTPSVIDEKLPPVQTLGAPITGPGDLKPPVSITLHTPITFQK